MARKPSNLPPGMRSMIKRTKSHPEGRAYYYLDRGIQPDGSRPYVPLGPDYLQALARYSELMTGARKPAVTWGDAARRFQGDCLAGRPASTQKDILWSLKNLFRFFDAPPAPFDSIKPKHVKQYIDWRSKGDSERKGAPVRANREIAWFSVIWNWARETGLTDAPNPCEGVRRNRETGRSVYIEDDELDAIKAHACEPLKDALDLAYLTGQRPGDVLRMRETDIRDGALSIRQGKTGAVLRMEVVGELASVVARCLERKRGAALHPLNILTTEKGEALTKSMLRRRFEQAREAAAQAAANEEVAERLRSLQFRDLRAKAGTDKADSSGDVRQAQQQLGHTSVTMTEHYVRARRGQRVKPTK